MQEQSSRISLRLVHPEAKLEVCDASLCEALELKLMRFACLHQFNQGTESPTHWRTNQQHWFLVADALLNLLHLLLITHAPACRSQLRRRARSPCRRLTRQICFCRTINSATWKFASATPSDMKITAISLMPIFDSSAGGRFGSSGGPISSDPRFLDGTTSSIRPLSAVLGLMFLVIHHCLSDTFTASFASAPTAPHGTLRSYRRIRTSRAPLLAGCRTDGLCDPSAP